MSIIAIGLNHLTAPLSVRERFAVPMEALPQTLAEIRSLEGVAGAGLLSTCNRTELYAEAREPGALNHWLKRRGETTGLEIAPALYAHTDREAVVHAYRVASGLDSMVLGEPQILGQFKSAAQTAERNGYLSPSLTRLFQTTFSVAKEVRSETAVGHTSVSMASAALKLAERLFGDLHNEHLLLIGVGEIVELAATHFVAAGPKSVTVANRTVERGEAFAERFNGRAITLAELPDRLHEFDMIITGTASTLPIIGKGMIERALKARRHRPVFIVDLAVPRDVEPEITKLDDVFLYTVDDLGRLTQQNKEVREASVTDAMKIVDRRADEFMGWLDRRRAVPAITQLRERTERFRDLELEKAAKALARGDDPRAVLEAFAASFTNKLLHHPTQALNRATNADRERLVDALDRLYPPADDSLN